MVRLSFLATTVAPFLLTTVNFSGLNLGDSLLTGFCSHMTVSTSLMLDAFARFLMS